MRAVWGADVTDVAYPVAVGHTLRALDLPLRDAIRLYLQAFAANLISAGVRLIPLGQTDGQRLVLALGPLFDRLADAALDADTDDALARTISKLRGRVTMLFIAHQIPDSLAVDATARLEEAQSHDLTDPNLPRTPGRNG